MKAPGRTDRSLLPTLWRLIRFLGAERWQVATVVLCVVGSTCAAAVGPRILGAATDVVFAGALGGAHSRSARPSHRQRTRRAHAAIPGSPTSWYEHTSCLASGWTSRRSTGSLPSHSRSTS